MTCFMRTPVATSGLNFYQHPKRYEASIAICKIDYRRRRTMPIIRSEEDEREGLMQVLKLMLLSARTAPKSGGVHDILTAIVFGVEKEILTTNPGLCKGEEHIL